MTADDDERWSRHMKDNIKKSLSKIFRWYGITFRNKMFCVMLTIDSKKINILIYKNMRSPILLNKKNNFLLNDINYVWDKHHWLISLVWGHTSFKVAFNNQLEK